MRIAFASEGEGLQSSLSQHFGRCPKYVFVELEGSNIKQTNSKNNPFFSGHEPGMVPEFIANEGADVIISGGMGPKAIEWFEQLGIKPITAPVKPIKELLEDYINGKLTGAAPCNDHESHP